MLDDKVCGTWWYCVNQNGSRWLVDGQEKPVKKGGSYVAYTAEYGWINLDKDGRYAIRDGQKLAREDFAGVQFPDRTYEEGPLEIEICKSGKVYWYDS